MKSTINISIIVTVALLLFCFVEAVRAAEPAPTTVSWSHEMSVMEEMFEDLSMFDDVGDGSATPLGLRRSGAPSFRRLAESIREIREYIENSPGG